MVISQSFSIINMNFLKNVAKRLNLLVGQVNGKIHLPNCKIHKPWAIEHDFLCILSTLGNI